MKWTVATLAVLALLRALPCPAEEPLGEIVYFEQELAVSRNGEPLDADSVHIGAPVENYDLLSTDETGYAELQLLRAGGAGTTVKISPNTTFSLELNRQRGQSRGTLGLVAGSVALKVQKLVRDQTLEVATESALMGVRGTSFEVTISPAGDVLVTSSEGSVSCRDAEGHELLAEPGQVVEQTSGESLRAIPVAVSDLQQFRRDWYAERLEMLEADPSRAVRFYALRYLALRQRFVEGYAELQGEKEVLRKWYEEDRAGRLGGRMDQLREKRQVIGHLFELRKTLFLFERVYFRLAELERYFDPSYGSTALRPGLSAEQFFQRFERDRALLARQMAEIRYVTKLYAARNGGSFPTDRFEEGERDFFGEETEEGFSF